ncbi:MAG: glycosyltransferase family 2 protein [Acidobacteriota bacterium]
MQDNALVRPAPAPKVSVVIPVFNRPMAVRRAIESVLAQTCQDFEIIVVDDGSTDTTTAAVEAIADPRITLIRHERNRGGSAARNTGIRASSADYVAFLDSDDEWLPAKLERQLEVFERSGDRLGLVYTGVERIFPDGSVSRIIARPHVNLARALLAENVVGETSLGMVRRSALAAVGGFDESLPSCQDLDLWLRICERFSAEVVPDPLVRVANVNDSGRITVSVPRTVLGRELYCRKHREKMIRFGVLHLFLRDSGWCQQRRGRDLSRARRFYLESLRANPVAPFTYALLFSAYLPAAWFEQAARCKRRVARLLGFGPETWFAEDSFRPAPMAKLQRNTKDPAAS